jgi:hypothetical protein
VTHPEDGPATLCGWQDGRAGLPMADRAQRMALQEVPMPTMAQIMVMDPETTQPVSNIDPGVSNSPNTSRPAGADRQCGL